MIKGEHRHSELCWESVFSTIVKEEQEGRKAERLKGKQFAEIHDFTPPPFAVGKRFPLHEGEDEAEKWVKL